MDPAIVIPVTSTLIAAAGLLVVIDRRSASRWKDTNEVITKAVKAVDDRLRTDLKDTEDRLRTDVKDSEHRLRTDVKASEDRLRTDLKDSEARFRSEAEGLRSLLDALDSAVLKLRVSILQMPRMPEGILSEPERLHEIFGLRMSEGISDVSNPAPPPVPGKLKSDR